MEKRRKRRQLRFGIGPGIFQCNVPRLAACNRSPTLRSSTLKHQRIRTGAQSTQRVVGVFDEFRWPAKVKALPEIIDNFGKKPAIDAPMLVTRFTFLGAGQNAALTEIMMEFLLTDDVGRGLVGEDQPVAIQIALQRQLPENSDKGRHTRTARDERATALIGDGSEGLAEQNFVTGPNRVELLSHALVLGIAFDSKFQNAIRWERRRRERPTFISPLRFVDRQLYALSRLIAEIERLAENEAFDIMGNELRHQNRGRMLHTGLLISHHAQKLLQKLLRLP
jgi:hypothetical protein